MYTCILHSLIPTRTCRRSSTMTPACLSGLYGKFPDKGMHPYYLTGAPATAEHLFGPQVLLPPASVVEVIESVPCFPSFRPCVSSSVLSWPMTPNNDSIPKTTMTHTREVCQRWGIFMLNRHGWDKCC